MIGGNADHIEAYVLVAILFVILAVTALALVFVFLRRRHRDAFFSSLYDNAAWIALPAVVESSRIEELAPIGDGGLRYSFDIKYRYEYAGVSYVASTICRSLLDFATAEGVSTKHADRLKNILPAGTHVTAFVDKLNPTTATLSIQDALYGGRTRGAVYLILTLFLFSMFGILCFVFGILYLWDN